MPGQLDQPASKTEQALESQVKFSPSIQAPLEDLTALTKVEQPELKLQGNNIEVPPITVKGWQADRTTGNTNSASFIELPNPYQNSTLEVAGRQWTDLGAGQLAPDGSRRILAEAAPPADSPGNRTLGAPGDRPDPRNTDQARSRTQTSSFDGSDAQGPPVNRDTVNIAWDDSAYLPQYEDTSRNPISILYNAIEGVGKALWALTPFRNSVRNGRLGCAASVSEVLQKSGYQYANHAAVGGLESQLMRNGWTKAPLSEAAPEDVVMVGRSRGWRAGGGNAHVGIVGENGTVYHNSSSRGQWIKDNLQARFGRGGEMFVLKPPADGRHRIDTRQFVAACNPEPSAVLAPQARPWWLPTVQQQQPSEQSSRPRGYQTRDTISGDYNAGYRSHDRFQPRYDDREPAPRYDQRYDQRDQSDRTARLDPQFDEQSNDRPRRGRFRMGGEDAMADRRGWQQRMMDRMRRQVRS